AGIILLVFLSIHADLGAMAHTLRLAGWRVLILIPYRALFYLLFALGWLVLLRPRDPKHRAGLAYLIWVSAVREGGDRLLPLASVGGSFIGVRLLHWRGLSVAVVAATIVCEVLLTMFAMYFFAGLGLYLLLAMHVSVGSQYRMVFWFALAATVPLAN